jgi:hypothetical protein
MASVIVSFGCSELLATRMRNDLLVSAYYVAISGCELMYADLKSTTNPDWGTPLSGTLSVGSNTVGTYSAVATKKDTDEFYIVSNGTVSGHTATATVLLGYFEEYSGPLNIGAVGAVTLNGASTQAKIKMDGPAASNSTVTIEGRVAISNDPAVIENAAIPKVTFWLNEPFNTHNRSPAEGGYAYDSNSDGVVTLAEAADQDKITQFTADDVNSDGVVDGKDAFIYYYTGYLNNPANNITGSGLNISPGEARYYAGGQTFTSSSIPDSVPIIFVNGDCTITINDGSTTDHTVVILGNLTLHQPNNSPGDRNTYVVWGNVSTDGEMGNAGGTAGDIVIFANGNIDKQGGGKMNASMFCNGSLNIDTAGDTGKKHLMMSKLTEVWSDAASAPLGIPPGYPANITSGFTVKNQTNYPPVWQRE